MPDLVQEHIESIVTKYMPDDWNEMIISKTILSAIEDFIDGKFNIMMLYGDAGTGKSSAARIISLKLNDRVVQPMNCSKYNRLREDVEAKLVPMIKQSIALGDRVPLVILNEFDRLSEDSQQLLKQELEETSSRVIIITNRLEKIIPALQSRANRIYFPRIKRVPMKKFLVRIVKEEELKIPERRIDKIVRYSRGDMRLALNSLYNPSIEVIRIAQFISYIKNKKVEEAISWVTMGQMPPRDFTSELSDYIAEHDKMPLKIKKEALVLIAVWDDRLSRAYDSRIPLRALVVQFSIIMEKYRKYIQSQSNSRL